MKFYSYADDTQLYVNLFFLHRYKLCVVYKEFFITLFNHKRLF